MSNIDLHTFVIRKIDNEWWFFDSADEEPYNISLD